MVRLFRVLPGIVLLALPVMALAEGPEPASLPAAQGTAQAGRQDLFIQVEGDLLTVKAKEVPQRLILEELAQRLGFELVTMGPLDERRSLELTGQPVEEGLKVVLHPASWASVYTPSPKGPRLIKVIVFPPSLSRASPPTSPRPQAGPASPATTRASQQQVEEAIAELSELAVEVEEPETRALALFGLATLGGGKEAMEAMFQIGGEEAVQKLQEALKDQSEEVRQAVQEMLGSVLKGSPPPVRP